MTESACEFPLNDVTLAYAGQCKQMKYSHGVRCILMLPRNCILEFEYVSLPDVPLGIAGNVNLADLAFTIYIPNFCHYCSKTVRKT